MLYRIARKIGGNWIWWFNWPQMKLTWYWRLKLLIVHLIRNSSHWWRPRSCWSNSLLKAVFMVQLFWFLTIVEYNNRRDTVLQMEAQEHCWFIHSGSDVWFVHGSWPCGTKSDFFSSNEAWLSHWPCKQYNKTNHTYNSYWWIFIWCFASKIANPPNLHVVPHQYFWLYGALWFWSF